MGKRGPGAKPLKTRAQLEAQATNNPHIWEAEGLSRAERVIRFIESLPVVEGLLIGTTIKLLPFQKKFLKAVYKVDKRGNRPIRQAVLSLPRKQGKTTLLAGMCLAHILGPESVKNGQCYSCANDRGQASILFKMMCRVIREVPWINERVSIREFTKELEDSVTGTVFQALSADSATKHGLSTSFAVYDEYGQSKTKDLFNVMASSMGARRDPLFVVISTQAPTDQAPFSELIDYGKDVNSGKIKDKTFHMTLYEAPKDADIFNEKVWKDCNPALGKYLSIDDMRSAATKAKKIASEEAAFRNLRLNQRVDAENRFISSSLWDSCSGSVPLKDLLGKKCYGGLDLSSTCDLSALVLFFPESGAVLPYFWLPGNNLSEKQAHDRVPYLLWKKEGYLQAYEGNAVDRREIALQVKDISDLFEVICIGYDRWRFHDLEKILQEEGITVNFQMHGQGFKDMSPSIESFETLLLNGKFKHGGNPVLRWCASNAVVVNDPSGNRKLDKSKSTGRIDGIIALVMACGMYSGFKEERALSDKDFSGNMVITF